MNIDSELPIVKHDDISPNVPLTLRLQEVWRQLPSDAQSKLAEVLVDVWARPIRPEESTILGEALPSESIYWEVCLYTNNLEQENDDAVRFIIAHELAHVFANHARPREDGAEFHEADEREADGLAVLWGFAIPAHLQGRY